MTKIKVTLEELMGTDISPVEDAKVSFDNDATVDAAGWEYVQLTPHFGRDQPILTDAQKGLVRYLVRGMSSKEYDGLVLALLQASEPEEVKRLLWRFRKTPVHAAPFGHCYLKFTVQAPVFVARQLVKHEYLRMSEVSRRYIKGQPEYFMPEYWAGIAPELKQGAGAPLPLILQEKADAMVNDAIAKADDTYRALLEFMAPEEARTVLPLCHMTRWRWSGSLDAFMNMCNLRLDDHAQSQTREVARQIGAYIKKAYPVSWSAYVEGDV